MIKPLNEPPAAADPVETFRNPDPDLLPAPAEIGTIENTSGDDYVSISGSPAAVIDFLQRLGWNYVGLD
jgi:hypothetical protein